MSACRTYVEDRLYSFPYSIFLRNADQCLEVGVYIILILSSCIVDQNLHSVYFRKFTPDVAGNMSIEFMSNGGRLSVDADDLVTFFKEEHGDSLADAL